MLCRKRGGTAPVSKILGEGIYAYGDALDCHPLAISIPGPAREERALADLVLSLNRLFPFGDGDIETALLVQGRLRLRVPPKGYRRESLALSSWPVDGVTPGPLQPRSRARI